MENGGLNGNGAADGSSILPKIHEALNIVYSPHSDNAQRKDAQIFLEEVKHMTEAPSHGFNLASDKSQSPVVRHYALSLLEHAIKHKWAEYNSSQSEALRNWVLQLSQSISREDPAYLRSKIAVLWVEIAKRSWASEWMNMDELLVRLWEVPDSTVHKELVLGILEMLSDEIFNGDDTVVALREGVLSKASVEIFTPTRVLVETFPNRQAGPDVRFGEEGWLERVTQLLRQCLSGDIQNSEELRSCAIRALAVVYSLMPWVIPNAVTATGCVPAMCDALRAPHVAVQKAALEALHALYGRTSFVDQEFLDLVYPLYDAQYIELFGQLATWAVVDPEDIDDDKYQFAKKLSELISFLGNYLDRRQAALPRDSNALDFKGFIFLLLQITQSQSLVVSIPVLVTWTRLLNNVVLGPIIVGEYSSIVGSLLDSCSSRLLRYESLPEDTQDPTYLFLVEDTDTVPERHAFLGNYRRYSSQIIESIVRLTITNALQHILSQTDHVLAHLYDNVPGFDMATYSKSSRPVLLADAQATVIEAALKGIAKWKNKTKAEDAAQQEQLDRERSSIEDHLESWCNDLLSKNFEDPLIRKRVLQLLVAFSTTALDKRPAFVLKVLEHILVTWPAVRPEHRIYTEAIKELQTESLSELQRLAVNMPDHLLPVYDQISSKVNEMIASGTLDEKRQVTYQTFLFTIVHRASQIPNAAKIEKLQSFIEPIKSQWQNAQITSALSNYDGFCQMMVLDKAQNYLARKQVHLSNDWGSIELDEEGRALQEELEKAQVNLPLRPTKSFLTCSVDKITKADAAYNVSCALWQDGIPVILPELLKFLNHAHAAHNAENWTGLPTEMRGIVSRVLTDRFWQAGISEGTKDDFYARVMDKKHTIEGLASTMRGAVRFVRETCYTIIYCMTRMDMQFYGFSELPGPLAHALLADSFSLSAHQLTNLLNLVRYLVDNCPVTLREHFLPPVLAACCQQMDAKINSEWKRIEDQQGVKTGGDALTEEMKAESILRQLTYTSVMMIADFLDPARTNKSADSSTSDEDAARFPTLRRFCLMHSSIVEPLLMFCTHVIRMRDSRSCGIMLRVFRSIVPEFTVTENSNHATNGHGRPSADIPAETASVIREYISSDVIKACITSIHEPYFVDLQKELASLIASIVVSYVRLTSSPRDVLLSLPNMNQSDVDRTIEYMLKETSGSRAQRAAVLELLRDLKGVSISEMGKLSKSVGLTSKESSSKKSNRTKLASQFMTAPAPPTSGGYKPDGHQDGTDNLEGVANLFEG